MNRAYKSIWSDRTQCFVAVSEATKGRGKRSSSSRSVLVGGTLALSMLGAHLPAAAVPSNTYVAQPDEASSNVNVETDGESALYVPVGNKASFTDSSFHAFSASPIQDNAAVFVESGASLHLQTSTVSTNGSNAAGIRVYQNKLLSDEMASELTLDRVTVVTVGTGGAGLEFHSALGGALKGQVTSGTITTWGSNAAGVLALGDATVVELLDTAVTTRGPAAVGVRAEARSKVKITGGSINTIGSEAHAVALSKASADIAVSIKTDGPNAHGLLAENGATAMLLPGNAIETQGTQSYGVFASGIGTRIDGIANITTRGANAHGVVALDGAKVDLSGQVTTLGMDAFGLLAASNGSISSGATISTNARNTVAVAAEDGGIVNLTSKSKITTSADYSVGVRARSGATVTAAGTIKTNGYASSGVDVSEAAATLQGGEITTGGTGAYGLVARRSVGTTLVDGTKITTYGDSAHGVYASDAKVMLNNVVIDTTGTYVQNRTDSSYGVLSSYSSLITGSARVTTSGFGASAAVASFDGLLSLKASDLGTTGDSAHGLVAFNATSEMNQGSISTSGTAAYGAAAYGQEVIFGRLASVPTVSTLSLTGVKVTTNGLLSHGVVAGGEYIVQGNNLGTSAGNAFLVDTTVTTLGREANAAQVAFGGMLKSTNGTFITKGQQSNGVWVDNGKATIDGGTITTEGDRSNALVAQNGAEITSSAVINTSGMAARGVYADNGKVTLTGGSVTTSGETGTGIEARGGNSVITSGVAVTTTGRWSTGIDVFQQAQLVLSDTASIKTTGLGSTGLAAGYGTKVSGYANISTEGESAQGVTADNAEISFKGGSITTKGLDSTALNTYGNDVGVTLTGVSIKTSGDASRGIYASRSLIKLTDVKISTAGSSYTYNWGYESDGSDGLSATYQSTVTGNASIATTGKRSIAARSTSGSTLDLLDSTLTTKGADAHGLVASGALATLTRGKIATMGDGAYGVSASGSTSKEPSFARGEIEQPMLTEVTLNDVNVTTAGIASHGVAAGGAPVVEEHWTITRAPVKVSTDGPGTVNLNNSTVTVTGAGSHAAQVGYGGALYAKNSTLTSEQGSGLSLIDGATVALSNTTVKSKNESMLSTLTKADANQNIVVGAGSTLTENNGVLLRVTRTAEGSGKVVLDLQDGSNSSGSIIDNLDGVTTTDQTGTYVTVGNKAIFNGQVRGVKEFNTLVGTAGQNLTFTGGSQLSTLNLVGDNAVSKGGTIDNPIIATSDVNVSNAAVFGGNWKIGGTLNVSNNSFVRPGNSVGVISVNQINWGVGTVYDAEINAAGQSDRIDVTGGGADLSKTALRVSQENGTGGYRLNYDYTVLTAAGAITPFLSTAYTGTEIVKLTPVYGANAVAVRLTVDEKKVEELPLTENQQEVVDNTLPSVGTNPAVDDAYQNPEPAKAFDQLSGEVHASTRSALIASASLLPNTISQRLRGNLDNGMAAGAPTASTAATTSSALPGSARPVWGQVVGNWQRMDGKNGSARLEQDLYGLYLGGDTLVRGGWRVGGVFGYTDGSVRVRDRQSRADVDSYSLGIYGGNSWKLGVGSLNAMVGAGYTWHDVDTRRSVSLGGGQELKAGYDASTAQVFGELGYAIPVNSRVTVEPYAGVAYLNQHTQGFRENGGSAALRGTSGNEDVTTTTLGLRSKTQVQVGPADVALQAGLGWRHAFGGLTPKAQLSLIEGGAGAFRVAGAPIAKDAAVVDLGAEVAVSRNTALGLSYSGQFGNGNRDNAGGLYLRVAF